MSEPVSPPRLRLVALFSLSLLLPLAGCDRDGFLKVVGYDQAKLLRKMVSQNDETLGRQYVESLRQHRFEQIEGDLEPNLKTPDIRQTLADMAQLFPPGELLSTKLVDVHVVHHRDSSRTSALTFEYEFISWHDVFATGLVFASAPEVSITAPAGCTWSLTLQGCLTNA